MDPQQFAIFLERNEQSTRETIERTVNGKINNLTKLVQEHNTKHEADMVDVREHIESVKPLLNEYTQREAARSYAKSTGDTVKWIAGVGSAVGVLWLMAAQFFK